MIILHNYIKLFSNRLVRKLTLSNIVNGIGSSLYSIVLLIMAKQLEFHSLAITLVTIGSILPGLIQIIPAKLASKRKDKYHAMILTRFIQGLFYIIVAFLAKYIQWPIFVLILLINLISDSFGLFNGGLSLVIEKRYVDKSLIRDLAGVYGAMATILTISGQTIGISILTLFHDNFQLVAIVNAITFFLAALILKVGGQKALNEQKAKIRTRKTHEPIIKRKIDHHDNKSNRNKQSKLSNVFAYVVQMPFLIGISSILIVNIIGAGLVSLLNLVLANQHIIFANYGLSVLVFSIATNTGLLIGNLVNIGWFKNATIKGLMIIINLIGLVYVTNLLTFKSGVALLILEFLMNFTTAKTSPILVSRIMAITSEKSLPTVIAKLNTIFCLADPIGTALFPTIYMLLGYRISFLILLIIFIISFIITCIGIKMYNQRKSIV